MKIGLPRFRISRKLLIITLGVTVLLGGTGVTALYFGGKDLVMKDGASAVGGECTDIQTMVLKTPSNHLWLRRFIRMENASGPERVRTALRIAGLLAKKNSVDLIHVSVLDVHGPEKRAMMRERAIGAEVLIALKPENLPEMKSPAMASYYEGPVSDEGRFYGDKVIVDIDEIGAMMTAMRTIEEKPDCIVPVNEAEDAAKAKEQGAKDKKEGHETKTNDHGAKSEESQGDKPASEDGGKPSAENAHGEEPVKEQSFMDGMLSMVGLGGSDEPAQEGHEPAANDHGKEPSSEGNHEAEAQDEEPAPDESADHAKTEEPAKEQSFLDGMLGMVGLGGSEEVAPVNHEAVAEEPGDLASEPGAKEHSTADDAATADHATENAHEKPTDDGHNAQDDAAHATVTPEEHDGKPVEHDAHPTGHDEAPAEEPAQSEDQAKPKKHKSNEHAETDMPVGD